MNEQERTSKEKITRSSTPAMWDPAFKGPPRVLDCLRGQTVFRTDFADQWRLLTSSSAKMTEDEAAAWEDLLYALLKRGEVGIPAGHFIDEPTEAITKQ